VLLRDGQQVGAANEERFSRVKQQDGVPYRTIDWLLKEGGVGIADCEKVSRELGRLLDVEDFIDHPYALEVSSPGLTRPLKKARDFERYKGRIVRIVTRTSIDDRHELKGEIVSVTGDNVEVKARDGVVKTIPLDEIKKANLEFEL